MRYPVLSGSPVAYLQMRWRNLESLEVSRAHVLTGIAVGILSLVLRTVISRGRGGENIERYSHLLHCACVPCGRGVVVDHLQWRQTLALRRKCCSRHAFSQRYPRLHSR